MQRGFKLRNAALLAALGLALIGSAAHAEPWTFGVIGDTQYTRGAAGNIAVNVNSVAVKHVQLVNQKFIEAGVKFVVQVGDLGDNTTAAALETRLQANWALNDAGIPFYGVRGNHDNSTAQRAYFRDHYLPASSDDATVAIGPDGMSYAVLYKGLKLVMLDYGITASLGAMPQLTQWMSEELDRGEHEQAVVVSHKNLLGQNHKDNLFGSSNDANPQLQNLFIGALADHDVRYYLSGHDHVHHRALVTSPNGESSVRQVITQSDSTKWYTPRAPYSEREQVFAQHLYMSGHYLYTIDGPRFIGRYFSTVPVNDDIADEPEWTLQETFGYSLNGVSRLVAQGEPYAMTHSIPAGTHFGEDGYLGTTMRILDGSNTRTTTVSGARAALKDLNIGWNSAASMANEAATSDVLSIWGMQNALGSDEGDAYALQLDYSSSARGAFTLMAKNDDGGWERAVERNFGGAAKFIVGPWKAGYELGTHGVDPATRTAWAVVNRGGEFAVLPSIEGDLNGDGVVDSRDAALLSQHLNRDASALPGADFDGDGRITVLDARKLTLICTLQNCAIPR